MADEWATQRINLQVVGVENEYDALTVKLGNPIQKLGDVPAEMEMTIPWAYRGRYRIGQRVTVTVVPVGDAP